jgi:rhodanese-related sulfurtransferase
MNAGPLRSTNRRLAALSLMLAAAAAAAGDPAPPRDTRVSALWLARVIRDGAEKLEVIDVRTAGAFAEFAVPEARNVPLASLETGNPSDLELNATIVLYADMDASAERAAALLRRRGASDVRVLRGGTQAWLDEVIRPALPSNASASERAAFRETAEVSRYFGGVPRIVEAGETAAREPSHQRTPRRRGCGI